jgi:hypothetical protein
MITTETLPLWVEYPAADPAAGIVIVERVVPDDVDEDFTRGVVRTLRDSYVAQFGDRQIPRSVIMDELDPKGDVAEREATIRNRVANGEAQYWVTRDGSSGDVTGLSRVMYPGNFVYLGDVIVRPPWRSGIGSKLLHAPFKFGGYPAQSRVELDGFEGSGVNGWYYKLGFRPNGYFNHFMIGERSMLIQRAVVPSTIGLAGVVRVLERERPELSQAILHTSRPTS